MAWSVAGRESARVKRRALWRERLEAWSASGLSQAEFCRRRGLKPVDFSWWKRTLWHGEKHYENAARSGLRIEDATHHAQPLNSPLFIPVELTSPSAPCVEIVLSNRRVIRSGLDCDVSALARLAAALESVPC
jgi:hypothetical protein